MSTTRSQPPRQPAKSKHLVEGAINVAAAKTLQERLDYLPVKDREFASSLLRQFKKLAFLSDKQWYWVRELAKRMGAVPGTR